MKKPNIRIPMRAALARQSHLKKESLLNMLDFVLLGG